jgi:hypothetical protein
MRRLLAIVSALLIAGCAHGQLSSLPEIENPENAAEIFIVRNKNFIGSTNSYTVALDGKDIFAIRIGEYTKFKVTPDQHYLTLKCFGGWSPTWKKMTIIVPCQPHEKYYLILSPDSRCAEIEILLPDEGAEWIKKSKYLPLEQ